MPSLSLKSTHQAVIAGYDYESLAKFFIHHSAFFIPRASPALQGRHLCAGLDRRPVATTKKLERAKRSKPGS
jgi:hypothetical protein